VRAWKLLVNGALTWASVGGPPQNEGGRRWTFRTPERAITRAPVGSQARAWHGSRIASPEGDARSLRLALLSRAFDSSEPCLCVACGRPTRDIRTQIGKEIRKSRPPQEQSR
jgi:hypothetical protein